MLFDIEFNGFWKKCFGPKANDIKENKKIALAFLENASNEIVPKLIRVNGHRYVPCFPDIMDLPVISIYQTDIIFYVNNLEDYFKREFGVQNAIQNFLKNYLGKASKNEPETEGDKDKSNNSDNVQNKQKEDNIEKEESNNTQEPADLHHKYIPFWEEIINSRFEDDVGNLE